MVSIWNLSFLFSKLVIAVIVIRHAKFETSECVKPYVLIGFLEDPQVLKCFFLSYKFKVKKIKLSMFPNGSNDSLCELCGASVVQVRYDYQKIMYPLRVCFDWWIGMDLDFKFSTKSHWLFGLLMKDLDLKSTQIGRFQIHSN